MVGLKVGLLGQVDHLGPRVEPKLAAVKGLESGNHLQQGRFARAVGANQAHLVALIQAKAGIAEDLLNTEVFGRRAQGKQSHG